MCNMPNIIILNTSEMVRVLKEYLEVFCIDPVEISDFIDRIFTIMIYRENISLQLIDCINEIKKENIDCFSDNELDVIGQYLYQFGITLFQYLSCIGIYLHNTNVIPYHFKHLIGNDIVLEFDYNGYGTAAW